MRKLTNIVNLWQYPLSDAQFRAQCKNTLDKDGVLVMCGFLMSAAVLSLQKEGINCHVSCDYIPTYKTNRASFAALVVGLVQENDSLSFSVGFDDCRYASNVLRSP